MNSDNNFVGYITNTGVEFNASMSSDGKIGPPGPRGEQGEKGEKGDKGDQGIQGIQGPAGQDGQNGQDGYTPVKGVDYFTAAEIAQIEADAAAQVDLSGKQDVLTAGANITISSNVISATDTTYTAGTNITIENGVISATGGGASYTAGTNIQISDENVISATDTTYNAATTTVAGLMSATDKTKLDNTFKELTSPVRIWDLDDGEYILPSGCRVYWKGATNTTNYEDLNTESYLFVTSGTNEKTYVIFAGVEDSISVRPYIYTGYTTSTTGNITLKRVDSILTSISSYVKDVLTYSTSGTTYALSAYQGYLLDQNKADKTELPSNFVGTDGVDAGTAGLVPAPTTSDTNKYLKSDGTWATVSSGSSDYTNLTNKPSINSVTLSGNKTTADLSISYSDLTNKPTIPTITYGTTDLTPRSITTSRRRILLCL